MEISEFFERFPHIIDKILGYVNNTTNASLTCTDFYKSVCRNEKFKKTLVIHGDILDDNFNSILKSERKFEELKLQDLNLPQQLKQVKEILATFGATVKKVVIDGNVYDDVSQLVNILNLLPQLETWVMTFVTIRNHSSGEADQSLTQRSLKTLELYHSDPDLSAFLPVGALQNVEIIGGSPAHNWSKFFMSQGNIKKLTVMNPLPVPLQRIHNLQLEEFNLVINLVIDEKLDDADLLTFLKTQTKLSKLTIEDTIEASTATDICIHLKNLQSLSIIVEEVSSQLMNDLAKLQRLKELKLSVAQFDVDTYTLVQFPRLVKLSLLMPTYSDVIDVAGLTAMQQAFPSLKEITFRGVFSINLCDMLNIFVSIELINMDVRGCVVRFFETTNLRPHNKIKTLLLKVVSHEIFSNDLLRIICNMPNLKILDINGKTELDEPSIQFLEKATMPALNELKIKYIPLAEGIKVDDRVVAALNKLKKIKTLELLLISNSTEPLDAVSKLLSEKFDEFKNQLPKIYFYGETTLYLKTYLGKSKSLPYHRFK